MKNETEQLREMVFLLTSQVSSLSGQLSSLVNVLANSAPQTAQNKYTLFEWFAEWLKTYKAHEVKTKSFYQLRNCIDKHFKPFITDMPLNAITAIDIDTAINKISSTRERKYTYDTVCAALKKAYTLDLITKDIASKTQSVRHTRKKRAPLTLEEEKSFLLSIPQSKYHLLWLFYLVSGVRRDEALRIKWADVNRTDNTLFIAGTKTVSAERFIPLFDDIKYILERLPHVTEYLFPYPLYSVCNTFNYMRNKNGFTFSLHNLRHTFATRHHDNGIADNVIQKWLGHSNVKTTQDIYIHLTPQFETESATIANSKRNLMGYGENLPLYIISKRARKNE